MIRTLAIVSSVAVVAAIGGLYVWTEMNASDDQFAQCRTTKVVGGTEQIGGPFSLMNSKGEQVTDKDVITQPSLLYFGYTFCPDVCPLDVARNAEATELLEENGTMITPVFISIDPKRDTPEAVGEFADVMHERMIGLTGTPDQVKAASQTYRTYYKAQPAEDEYYLVDHSTLSYLVLPEHGFVEYFRRDVLPEQMAETIQCFVDAS